MAKNRLINENTYAKGDLAPDAPGGFRAQTPAGTSQWSGTGWNKDFDFEMPELAPDATRPAGRSNRTGE